MRKFVSYLETSLIISRFPKNLGNLVALFIRIFIRDYNSRCIRENDWTNRFSISFRCNENNDFSKSMLKNDYLTIKKDYIVDANTIQIFNIHLEYSRYGRVISPIVVQSMSHYARFGRNIRKCMIRRCAICVAIRGRYMENLLKRKSFVLHLHKLIFADINK